DYYSAGHKQVIVIAHGFFNSKNSVLLKKLAAGMLTDFDIILLDFRGHGKSEGLFYWTSKEYLDLNAVLEFAQAKYEKVGLIGFSLGAATSIIALAKNSNLAQSLIVVSGPTEFEKIDCKFWEINLENDIIYNLGEGAIGKGVRPGPFWLKKDKPINLAEKLSMPVCFIHGDKDWVIYPNHSRELFEKVKTKKQIRIINQGPHAEYLMRNHSQQMLEIIKNWFKDTLNQE
ncbi:MAG: alpha/beta hydrolase, partial [Candidatus Omnitrophica bacterium]|nr:alpha/beta hydrolase [Candidatus Omnitrophota bacterium]